MLTGMVESVAVVPQRYNAAFGVWNLILHV
jgi:hypothetical protein